MACSKCNSTPQFGLGVCKVYINTSVDDLFLKITEIVQARYKIESISNKHLELQIQDFETFIYDLSLLSDLSPKEGSAINVLPVYPQEVLDFTTYSKTKPLNKWISLLKSKELLYILRNNRLVTYFQPIVDIRNNSIYGYELLSRGLKEDGSIMPPGEMFELAQQSELTFNLDRQARETAIISAAREKITQKLFINFLPSVIYSPKVCLKTTIDLINKYHFKAHNITFE